MHRFTRTGRGHGARAWYVDTVLGHHARPWCSGTMHDHGARTGRVGPERALGHGARARCMDAVLGHGAWARSADMARGHGARPPRTDTARGHGAPAQMRCSGAAHPPWRLATALGRGAGARHALPVPAARLRCVATLPAPYPAAAPRPRARRHSAPRSAPRSPPALSGSFPSPNHRCLPHGEGSAGHPASARLFLFPFFPPSFFSIFLGFYWCYFLPLRLPVSAGAAAPPRPPNQGKYLNPPTPPKPPAAPRQRRRAKPGRIFPKSGILSQRCFFLFFLFCFGFFPPPLSLSAWVFAHFSASFRDYKPP